MTDEELFLVAADRQDLVEEAVFALDAEMQRRGLNPGQAGKLKKNVDEPPKYHVLRFFHRLHGVYADNARLLITIITPAAILGGCAVLLALNRAHALLSQGFHVAASIVRLGGLAASFLVNVFAFGAVATAIQRVSAGVHVDPGECYTPVRARAGTIAVLASILFAFAALAVVAGMAVTTVAFILSHTVPGWTVLSASYIAMALGFTVTATYSLSVPAAVFEGASVKAALKRSDFLTGNSFGQIFLLVAEALITGYVAGVLPYWVATLIAQKVGWAAWADWVLWAAAVYGVAMADLVLLIGLSILYFELTKSAQCSAKPGQVSELQPW